MEGNVKANFVNDLYFIDYDAKMMIGDTCDMRPDTELAHRRLFDLLVIAALPPKDDDVVLRQHCKVPLSDWARIKGELIEKGWHVENGRFTHGGTMKTIARCKEKHELKVSSGKKGAERRWGSATGDANSDAISEPNGEEMSGQSQLQSQVQLQSHVQPGGRSGASGIRNEKELERIEKRIEEIRQQGTLVAGSPMRYSTKQKSEMIALKDRREELKKLLGFVA